MKTSDIIRRAGRNLRRAKMRTFLTSFAISVGAFTIMMALAAGEGTREYSKNLVESNIDPQALFIVKDKKIFESSTSQNTGLREYDENTIGVKSAAGASRDIKPITQADVDKIAARDDIESVQPIYTPQAKYLQFEGNDKKYAASLSLYDPDVRREISAGQLPDRGVDISDAEIVIPDSFAKTLNISDEKLIGKTVTITAAKPPKNLTSEDIQRLYMEGGESAISSAVKPEEKTWQLKIVAISKAGSMTFAGDSSMALLSANTARQIYDFTSEGTEGHGKFFGMSAKVKSGVEPKTVKDNLDKNGFGAQTADDLQSLLFTIVNTLQAIVAGFGLLALVASIFGIINTMYISVLERTSQIGLMRALGMRASAVGRMFRYEAAWIGFLGGIIGIGLAYVAVWALNPWINQKLDLGGGNFLLAFVWWQALALLVGLIVVAIIAGWLPSRKAAKLDPIEALRTE